MNHKLIIKEIKNKIMTPPIPKVQPGQGGPITNVTSQDVISGRGQKVENHPGNVNFKIKLQLNTVRNTLMI